MKFSQSLLWNAVSDWRSHYIAYDALKSSIYKMEKDALLDGSAGRGDAEQAPLLASSSSTSTNNIEKQFTKMLDAELERITDFYVDKERELLGDLVLLKEEVESADNDAVGDDEESERSSDDDEQTTTQGTNTWGRAKGMTGPRRKSSYSFKPRRERAASTASSLPGAPDEGEEEAAAIPSRKAPKKKRRMSTSASENDDWTWRDDRRIMYKRRVVALFTALSELKGYVSLNHTGLSKVLKKFDKVTNSSLRQKYMQVVDSAFPFEKATQDRLTNAIQSLVPMFSTLNGCTDDESLVQLKSSLREHVVWERNTVWREMIGLERKGWGKAGTSAPIVHTDDSKGADAGKAKTMFSRTTLSGTLAIALFLIILNMNWFDRVEEQNCLALLALVTIFWALEIVPLFVTALFVPFLVVVLRVLRSGDDADRRLTASEATKFIFSQMFSPTIMLLLGGFTLAAALSKQNIDKVLATKVLSLAGTKPRTVLFSYMCVACFASMWISNVAAPVLCYSLIQPILRTLPKKAPFSKALILGIALASNIGGMASPISSPQNLIALEYMNPPLSWLGWFAVSIPVSFSSIVLIWVLLLFAYRSGPVSINPVRVSRDPWTREQYFVSAVTVLTIVLWCVESQLAWLLGDMGIIAILPIIAFYGTGILRKADFDHSPWSIVFLAMGGIALGKAVLSSGLLDDMDHLIERLVLGLDIWPILAIFSVIVLVIATLISHTIASVLVVPIAARIGSAMDVPHPRLLIFSTALICSAGMGLPISGFPNLQAINVEDDIGQRYLEPADFFKNGIPSSVIAVSVIISIGYGLMRLMGL